MFSILLGILLGVGVSFQTAINAKLRSFLNAPFLASFVSFSVGTLTLLLATATHSTQPLSGEMLEQAVWWSWLGGLLGMLGLTGNILLFPKLGAVQTAVMPIFGQILMAMLIDHFGWLVRWFARRSFYLWQRVISAANRHRRRGFAVSARLNQRQPCCG